MKAYRVASKDVHLFNPWRKVRISPEQRKYIIVVTFFLRQADDKHRFESPDIIRLVQVVFRESLATRCTIVNASGYRLYSQSETSQTSGCAAPSIFFSLLLLRYTCITLANKKKFLSWCPRYLNGFCLIWGRWFQNCSHFFSIRSSFSATAHPSLQETDRYDKESQTKKSTLLCKCMMQNYLFPPRY